MARIYREHPDSSYLTSPRIFTRVFCTPGDLIDTVRFYETLTQTRLDMDMDIPEAGLHVVAVDAFLILELDAHQHQLAAQTTVTVLNADLDQAVHRQVDAGAEIVQERWDGPVGSGVRLRHPDGLIVEYLQHRPTPHDVNQPSDQLAQTPVSNVSPAKVTPCPSPPRSDATSST